MVFIPSKLWKSIIYIQLRAEALCPWATVCCLGQLASSCSGCSVLVWFCKSLLSSPKCPELLAAVCSITCFFPLSGGGAGQALRFLPSSPEVAVCVASVADLSQTFLTFTRGESFKPLMPDLASHRTCHSPASGPCCPCSLQPLAGAVVLHRCLAAQLK